VFPKGSAASKHSSKSRLIHKQKRLEPCNPQAVDAESARVLPIILATKLLPEMEAADAAALAAHRAAAAGASAEAQYGALLVRPKGVPFPEWNVKGLLLADAQYGALLVRSKGSPFVESRPFHQDVTEARFSALLVRSNGIASFRWVCPLF
jgi:hypothetical protein